MDLKLAGKIALVTGGSKGIGLAIAEAFAREKANVIICARSESEAIKQAKRIADKYPVKCLGVACDVAKPDDINGMMKTISKKFPAIDILINNAGTGSNEKVMDAKDSKWQYYWDLHLMAAVRLSRAVIPLMKKRKGGVIINNASICAKQPLGYEPIYNVTKAALMMFSKCLSNEVVKDNIRVNCVNPGLVLTPDWIKTAKQLTQNTKATYQDYLDDIAKKNAPIGRFGTPSEIAGFFMFLASPLSSYCVGSTYYVDGGWLNVVA